MEWTFTSGGEHKMLSDPSLLKRLETAKSVLEKEKIAHKLYLYMLDDHAELSCAYSKTAKSYDKECRRR